MTAKGSAMAAEKKKKREATALCEKFGGNGRLNLGEQIVAITMSKIRVQNINLHHFMILADGQSYDVTKHSLGAGQPAVSSFSVLQRELSHSDPLQPKIKLAFPIVSHLNFTMRCE